MDSKIPNIRYAIMNLGSLRQSVANGQYESWNEVTEKLEQWRERLDILEAECKEIFEKSKDCDHEYDQATYTMRTGFYRHQMKAHYEHECIHCEHQEFYVDNKDTPAPDWTKDASERYYNNDF